MNTAIATIATTGITANRVMKLLGVALAMLIWLGVPVPVVAQATPAPALPAMPSIPQGVLDSPWVRSILDALGGITQSTNGNTAAGRVTFFRRFDLQMETAPGVYRAVHLHQGTIINPRGTTLTPGQVVVVNGAAQRDGSLNADAITVR
jgi:hypothetical protein